VEKSQKKRSLDKARQNRWKKVKKKGVSIKQGKTGGKK